jgi:hypothetical protein
LLVELQPFGRTVGPMALVSLGSDGRPDHIWRVEPRGAGLYDLRLRRALVLEKVPLDRVVNYMLEHGGDPEQLVER